MERSALPEPPEYAAHPLSKSSKVHRNANQGYQLCKTSTQLKLGASTAAAWSPTMLMLGSKVTGVFPHVIPHVSLGLVRV